jgi:hypothetical protein
MLCKLNKSPYEKLPEKCLVQIEFLSKEVREKKWVVEQLISGSCMQKRRNQKIPGTS